MQFSGAVFSGDSPPLQYTQRRKPIQFQAQSQKPQSLRWQGPNRGPVTPFGVVRGFTPRHCLRSRASYPLPRASSVRTSWETVLSFGADSAGLVHPSRTTFRSKLVPTHTLTQSRPRTRVHREDTRIRTQGAATTPGPMQHTRRGPDTPRARRTSHRYHRKAVRTPTSPDSDLIQIQTPPQTPGIPPQPVRARSHAHHGIESVTCGAGPG